MEEIDGLGIPLRSLWPTLHCRRVAGVSALLSIGWWYLSFVSPKRHCCRVSAADKGCRVYPLDPRTDAVALYSGCTPGKLHAWFLPDDRQTASLVGLRGGWRHVRTKMFTHIYGSNAAVPGPKLPTTIKAGYLNCKIRPYIRNPLRCFKCQSFGDSQTTCHGQLICSRYASVGHSSTDCNQEPKYENITKVKCPPLNLLQPLPKPDISISTPVISTSSSTQAHLLPATSSTATAISDPQPPPNNTLSTTNNMFTSLKPSSTMSASLSNSSNQNPSDSTIIQNSKKKTKTRDRKRKKELLKTVICIKMAQHRPRKSSNVEYTTDEENMIVYDEENEIESNDADKFAMKECYKNNPETYLRAVTPTRFRKSRY
ncbi:uncharacterized protein TNCV_3023411 [Trichonephila clavipes]|uniref:Uncharacterized protein n=1 Tax=Trichonephila clavipes TaxID=2585209 RepID=A0A8X6RRW2_TRICX|nr:uncharacterized protein TNCV_3023411 [Trichonephila clavipes]